MNRAVRFAARSAALTILCVSVAAAQPALTVEDAWVRAAPPGARVMAAYMTLHNTRRRSATLVGVESGMFERVEIHRSFTEDGISRMARVERLDIPGRGSVALEPGGLHLMLVEPRARVQEGDTIDLMLVLEDDWRIELTVPVHGTRPHAR